jgi:hypothetical protein
MGRKKSRQVRTYSRGFDYLDFGKLTDYHLGDVKEYDWLEAVNSQERCIAHLMRKDTRERERETCNRWKIEVHSLYFFYAECFLAKTNKCKCYLNKMPCYISHSINFPFY